MGLNKQYNGYKSFSYLTESEDYESFKLSSELNRLEPEWISLSQEQEDRVFQIARDHVMISMHEHLGIFPDDVFESPAYCRAVECILLMRV